MCSDRGPPGKEPFLQIACGKEVGVMTRPLAVIGFSFLTALAAALYLGEDFRLPLMAILLAAGVICLLIRRLRKRRVIPAICLSAAAALLVLTVYSQFTIAPFDCYLGKDAVVSGQICEEPYEQYGRFYYPLRVSSVRDQEGENPCSGKVLISAEEELPADVFDELTASVSFSAERSGYRLSKGYLLSGWIRKNAPMTVKKTEDWSLYRMMIQCRRAIREALSELLPQEEASLTMAILTGSKQGLSEEMNDRLKQAGISHIAAVSGFHLSLVTALVVGLLYWLTGRHKQRAALLGMVFVVLYMMLAGFSPSVTRAGIMQLLLLLGIGVYRQADGLNSLGASVLLMTLLNPYSAADTGLLLSFSATLGILLLTPRINRYFGERLRPRREAVTRRQKLVYRLLPAVRKLSQLFSVSLAAFLFTLPVMILCFRTVYCWSVAVNMLVMPLLTVLIICVLLLLLVHFSVVLSFLEMPFAVLTVLFTDSLTGLAGGAASLPFSSIRVSQAIVPIWLLCAAAGAGVLFLLKARRRAVQVYALVTVLTFFFSVGINGLINRTVTKLAVLDTGNGVTLLLVHDGAASVFSCGGDSAAYAEVEEWMAGNDIDRIPYLLLTDSKMRTSRYAEKLLRHLPVGTAEVYDKQKCSGELCDLLEQTNQLICRRAGTGSHITRLDQGRLITGVEDGSGYVYFESDGLRLLFCSDGTDCRSLPPDCRSCDVLVINGSVDSLQEIRTKTLVVSGSVKGELSSDFSADLLSTLDGHIIIRLDPGQYRIRRESTWLN